MPLSKVNLSATANKLDRPFNVSPLAAVADLSISLFICQGQVAWHRHLDEDELFLVHEGVVGLDTERGRLTLHSEELVVVPKGVAHRSGSQLRSIVVLIRPAVLSDRKNGHRRYALDTDPPLEKVRLARVQAMLAAPYQAITVAQVEDFELLLMSVVGAGPRSVAAEHSALWLALRGRVALETDSAETTYLEAGELLSVPRGTAYQFTSETPGVLLTLARAAGGAAG
jgi:mannose-6-phosphate isomerase-like protein (cupin superfamily)